MKLHEELNHPRKGLINIQNIDNSKFFKWSLVKYLNPADRNWARIIKTDKEFPKKLIFFAEKHKFFSKNWRHSQNWKKEIHWH